MKYKKYLLFITILSLFGMNRIYAETCYYQIKDEMSLVYNTNQRNFKIDERYGYGDNKGTYVKIKNDNKKEKKDDKTGISFPAIEDGTCPNYIVYRHAWATTAVYGFIDYTKAKEFRDASDSLDSLDAKLVSKSKITESTYNSNLVKNNLGSDGYYCRYVDNYVAVGYNPTKNSFTIVERGTLSHSDIKYPGEKLINRNDDFTDGTTRIVVKKIEKACPQYIVYRRKERTLWAASDGIFGFNNYSEAKAFQEASDKKNMNAWFVGYTNQDGSKINEEELENRVAENVATIKENVIKYSVENSGTDVEVNCDEIFGSKNDEESIAYLVNEILKYPRYIVPVLLILFGTLDFFKAVIAGKEDEMKKAQKTFIKRVIVGVAVFLIPVIINALMWLADIAWEGLGYTHCDI